MHRLAALLLGSLAARSALAHGGHSAVEGGAEQVLATLLVAALVVGATLYARGLGALWRRAGGGRGISRRDASAFALGWIVLAASLLAPIDGWAERSFAVHMVQHELLMVVAAPLIVLGRPLETWTWAVSPEARRFLGAAMKAPPLKAIGSLTTLPLAAWIVHAVALWLWHVPMLFRAALADPLVHILQHACFFGSALAYWWSVFGRARQPKGSSVASLFTTMLHTSALGALLTFAPSPWYAGAGAPTLGLSALEDQQLGGLVMWVPGGLAYLIAGLHQVRQWLLPRPAAA